MRLNIQVNNFRWRNYCKISNHYFGHCFFSRLRYRFHAVLALNISLFIYSQTDIQYTVRNVDAVHLRKIRNIGERLDVLQPEEHF